MTIRVNKQAVYAKAQTDANKAAPDGDNIIPVSSDISKTFLEDNSIEKPELRPTFGATDSVIISQTQALTVPTFIQGGGVPSSGNTKMPHNPPVHPLLLACFHKQDKLKKDLSASNSDTDTVILRYTPTDDDTFGSTILYNIDKINQEMTSAKGTMSLNIAVGEFATMTFEIQSPYNDPVKGTAPAAGSPNIAPTLAVSGQDSLKVPGLPTEFANCVRGFSLTQNVTISAIDCATRAGGRKITYEQTARAATGELVVDMDEDTLAALVKKWGGKSAFNTAIAAPLESNALVFLGTENGNKFAVHSNNYKIGAPTVGDTDGIGTWTFPITFLPKDGKPDYELYYIGDDA